MCIKNHASTITPWDLCIGSWDAIPKVGILMLDLETQITMQASWVTVPYILRHAFRSTILDTHIPRHEPWTHPEVWFWMHESWGAYHDVGIIRYLDVRILSHMSQYMHPKTWIPRWLNFNEFTHTPSFTHTHTHPI